MTLLLVAQGLVFAVWVVLAFRSLWRLLGVMQKASGNALPGLRSTMQAPRVFLTEPQFKPDRRSLGLTTLVLLMLTLAFAGKA